MAQGPLSLRPRPAAICFDLDGVLIDSMPLHAKAWQQAMARHGLAAPRRDIYRWEGESGRVTAQTLLSRAGHTPSHRAVRAVLAEKERRFKALAARVAVLPRLARLVGRLAAGGMPLALVTGTARHEVLRVVPRALLSTFTVVVTGDQVRRGKPHPEPYRRAFAALGVRPSRAVVVENAPYGIRSARAARTGLVVALASSLPPPYLRGAHVIVRTVPELCRLLARLAAAD